MAFVCLSLLAVRPASELILIQHLHWDGSPSAAGKGPRLVKRGIRIRAVVESAAPDGNKAQAVRSAPALRVGRWLGVHWLALTNTLLVLVLVGAVAPVAFAAAGLEDVAAAIHHVYLILCPQRPAHSYFLFGHQLALEHREIAMFAAQIGGGLLYATVRDRPDICLQSWALFVVSLPMALDIFGEMLGVRESDWFTRTWTGALFNMGFALWFYPRIITSQVQAKP
jgi:uncharacterized membrane protein